MGTLVGSSALAATHSNGVPNSCATLVAAWTDPDDTVPDDEGYWLVNPFTDLEAPSGGLFGGAAIVNVDAGAMTSYDAKALNGFATSVDANDVLHQEPGRVFPSLNSGDVTTGTVFSQSGAAVSSSGLTRGVDAVSFVFMHDQIMNEYTTQSDIGGATEWVITFPTKHFYTYSPSSGSTNPVAPFTSTWDDTGSCEVVLLDTIWDREEQTFIDPIIDGNPIPPIVSPAPPGVIIDPDAIIPFELCFEVSVIVFGSYASTDGSSPLLGSSNVHTIDNTAIGFSDGWARLQLDDYPHDADGNGIIDDAEAALSRDELGGLQGLPVTGFAVQRFANGFLGDGADVLANYAGIYQHKATRKLGSLISN
jgi:hypothetical protein